LLYSCGLDGFFGFRSAWLSGADFRRLLPVCCPRWQPGARASGRLVLETMVAVAPAARVRPKRDPLLTMELLRQPVATHGNGFSLI
jgi:hypothetical protein